MALRRRAKASARSGADEPTGPTLPPWLDPKVQDPETWQLTDHLMRSGDPEPIQHVLDGLDDPGEQSLRIREAAGFVEADRRPIDRWVEVHGARSALPWTALAEWHTIAAWEIRGGAYSPTLDNMQFEAFTQHLRDAEAASWQGHVADPDSPLPWVPLLITGRGLNVPVEETIARWDRLDRCGREISGADAHLLQCIAPKWHGTEELMFAFARKLAEDAPPGSARPTLICRAHIERLLAAKDHNERELYRARPAVREELAAVISTYFGQAHEGPDHARINGLNAATFAAWQFELAALAQHGHQLIGHNYTDHPWHYEGAADQSILRSRQAGRLGPP